MPSRGPLSRPGSSGRLLTFVAGTGFLLACADASGIDQSPDVLGRSQGASRPDTTAQPSGPPPTTPGTPTPPNTPASPALRGTVVDVPSDSTQSWRAVGSVRLELGQRDAAGAVSRIGSTTSDADGRFTFDDLTLPTGLLYVRAVPADARYRATRWIAAYTLLGPTAPTGQIDWFAGPYLVLERSDAPQRAYAPTLAGGKLIANAVPVPGTVNGYVPVPDATVLISLPSDYVPGPDSLPPLSAGGPVASARTDAAGRFLVQLPGPGTYHVRATTGAGSLFESMSRGYNFTARASAEATEVAWLQFRLDRR